MTTRLRVAAAVALAVAIVLILLAVPAQAHPGHKPGPVCKWKDRHHKSCIVILAPKGKATGTVVVTPYELPKQV